MKALEKLSALAGKYFAVLVILAAVIAFIFPSTFVVFGSYIPILLGIVMFGMGAHVKTNGF